MQICLEVFAQSCYKQTNNDENISSLAEVIIYSTSKLDRLCSFMQAFLKTCRVVAAHGRFSCIRQVAPVCTVHSNLIHASLSPYIWRDDGQNYDSQDRASIAASRGKNHFFYSAYLLNTHLDAGCDQHCRWASKIYDAQRRTNLTAPETINHSRDRVVPAKI